MIRCTKNKKLRKYKLITIAMVLACMNANSYALADTINVTNASELKAAINSATVVDIVLSNDIDMSGIRDLSIKSKDVNIDGNYHGISSSRNFALLLDTKTNLTIKNVGQVDKDYNIISSFNNNYATTGSWGGPITTQNYSGAVTHYDDAKVVIEKSVFSNNFAPTDGGVIGLQTIDFDIKDSVFINNSSAQEGGAIWAEVNYGNIENCYFKGNFVRAKGSNTSIGGAITQYGYYANRPTYIDNISGTFIENYSYNFGGAITNREANATAEINKIAGDFQSNYAIQTGGAILNAAGTINSIDGTFTNNYLLNTNTSSSAVKNSTLLLNNSFGGAIANTQTGKMAITKYHDMVSTSDKMKSIIEDDERIIINNAKITSELITKFYADFNIWFTRKYAPLVGTGDCMLDGDEFRKALQEWCNSQPPEKQKELELCNETILKIIEATKKGIAVRKQ